MAAADQRDGRPLSRAVATEGGEPAAVGVDELHQLHRLARRPRVSGSTTAPVGGPGASCYPARRGATDAGTPAR
jgi:hypothetical protein